MHTACSDRCSDAFSCSLLGVCLHWSHLDPPSAAAPDGVGEGGVLLCDVGVDTAGVGAPEAAEAVAGEATAAAATGDSPRQQEAAGVEQQETNAAEQEPQLLDGPSPAAPPAASSSHSAAAAAATEEAVGVKGEAAEEAAGGEEGADDFVPAGSFAGARPGYAFKLGELGMGYYLDGCAARGAASPTPEVAAAVAVAAEEVQGDDAAPPAAKAAPAPQQTATFGAPGGTSSGPRHHWGQALQYLDRSVGVAPGRRLALLARREEGKVRFSLRQGVGEYVGRPPWKEEWGGGASVENPHVQRVHYCELLASACLECLLE